MPYSHHSHSGQFCKHASGLLESVVREAIQQGFNLYGLTEHVPRHRIVDLYPEEENTSLDELRTQFDAFLQEAHRLKLLYSSQINLLIGLETEYISDLDLDGLEKLLEVDGSRVQYLVGSVHHVNGIPIDFDPPTYRRALDSFAAENHTTRQQAFLEAYFDAQHTLLRRFKPEIIGHFDLCRLYCPDLRFEHHSSVWEKMERNIKLAINYGALFEINTAAYRKDWSTAYPGPDVIKVVLRHGGRFTFSDDSHGPHGVGLNYHRLPEYLQFVGISEIWYLQESTVPNAAGRTIQPVRLDGDWLDHVFWREHTS